MYPLYPVCFDTRRKFPYGTDYIIVLSITCLDVLHFGGR